LAKPIPAFEFTKKLEDSLGFSLTKLEESYFGYNARKPHRHKYYEVLFFTGTGGSHEIDFKSYQIKTNSIHFISPQQVHLLQRKNNVTGTVISFKEDFFLEAQSAIKFTDQVSFLNNPYSSPILQLNKKEHAQEILQLIGKIEKEYISEHIDKHLALVSWVKLFLILCKRLYLPESRIEAASASPSEITRNFKKLIDKQYRKIKSVSEYAQLLNITAGHLNDTIHKDLGKTAGELIHDRIILEAKRLLYHSEMSIKEIAAELHYEDPSYFGRFFKTHSGNTPDQFRKAIREKYQ